MFLPVYFHFHLGRHCQAISSHFPKLSISEGDKSVTTLSILLLSILLLFFQPTFTCLIMFLLWCIFTFNCAYNQLRLFHSCWCVKQLPVSTCQWPSAWNALSGPHNTFQSNAGLKVWFGFLFKHFVKPASSGSRQVGARTQHPSEAKISAWKMLVYNTLCCTILGGCFISFIPWCEWDHKIERCDNWWAFIRAPCEFVD